MAADKEPDFVSITRRLWDAKVPYHLDSSMYNLPGFLTGTTSLNRIELDLRDDLHGKRVLHLQCHFGLDSLSLIRQGAAHVTGVDLTPSAIDKARQLAETIGLTESTRFICCNIYDLPKHLPDEEFDIVHPRRALRNLEPSQETTERDSRQFRETHSSKYSVDENLLNMVLF